MPLLPYFLNVNGDLHQRAGLALGRDRAAGQRLAVVLVEHRLRIEAVDLRQAAVHEQEDDALRARRMIELALVDGRRPAPSAPAACASDSPTRLANASMPKPLPMRHSASRRVMRLSGDLCRCHVSPV